MNRQTRTPLCWVLVSWMTIVGTAVAQGPVPRPKFGSWNPPAANAMGYYSILGEIAKPGVYSAEGREITLQELIHQAGGVTPNASPAVRLVRQNRVAQGHFFDPAGRVPLVAGDVVLIEPMHASPAATQAVSICMIGVMDRPVIVPMRPDQAQLGTIMLALQQSPELVRSLRVIVPTRQRPPASPSTPLVSGTVLIFDSKLLIAGNLPVFPDAIPLPRAVEPLMTNVSPPASIGIPQPSVMPQLPDQIPDNRLPVTTAARNNGDVEATTLPFSNGGQRPQANAASLPVPGSRLQPEPALPIPTNPKPKAKVPTINPDSEIVTSMDDDLDLNIDDAPVAETPASVGFSLWQLLGIGGTVASLVGLAVLSRNLMGKDSPRISSSTRDDDDIVPASIKKRSAMPTPHMSRRQRRFDVPEPTDSVAKAPRFSTQPIAEQKSEIPTLRQEPHDLAELLAMQGPIETEGVVLPHGLKLRRSPLSAVPLFRVDEAAELPGPPHEKPVPAGAPQRSLDAAAMKIPAPHFKTAPPSAMEPAPEMVESAMISGKAIERALHQLLRGKPS